MAANSNHATCRSVQEGDSITVLCIALGTPTPTVTLYVAGHPIRSTTSRHMVTTLHNVTRLMSEDQVGFKDTFSGFFERSKGFSS